MSSGGVRNSSLSRSGDGAVSDSTKKSLPPLTTIGSETGARSRNPIRASDTGPACRASSSATAVTVAAATSDTGVEKGSRRSASAASAETPATDA